MTRIKGQTPDEWLTWLRNELVEDGTKSHVLHNADPAMRKQVYHHVIGGFIESLTHLKLALKKLPAKGGE